MPKILFWKIEALPKITLRGDEPSVLVIAAESENEAREIASTWAAEQNHRPFIWSNSNLSRTTLWLDGVDLVLKYSEKKLKTADDKGVYLIIVYESATVSQKIYLRQRKES